MSKCEIAVEARQCKKNLVSGCTIEVDGQSVHCCRMHYNLYKGKKNVPVFTSTPIIKEEEVKEDPNTPWNGHCECGACTTIGERDACYAEFIARMNEEEKCVGCEAPMECCKTILDGTGNIVHTKECNVIPEVNPALSIEASAQKLREFPMHCGKCKGYHKSADDVKRCYGHVVVENERTKLGIPFNVHYKTFEGGKGELMIDEWHSTMDHVNRRGKELGRGKVRRANNKNGFWICYVAEVK